MRSSLHRVIPFLVLTPQQSIPLLPSSYPGRLKLEARPFTYDLTTTTLLGSKFKFKFNVTLRLKVSQSVSLGAHDQIFTTL
jgi:hypothetical protein